MLDCSGKVNILPDRSEKRVEREKEKCFIAVSFSIDYNVCYSVDMISG